MRKLMIPLVLLLTVIAWACPDPQTGKIDPYLTARIIVLQANTSLALADGIFNQWLLGQTAEKQKKASTTYQKIKIGVVNGLQLALNGVTIAEQAKKDLNFEDLMVAANDAWTNLRKFLEDLFGKPAVDVAASQPTAGEVKIKRSALTTVSPLTNLPKTLY